MTARTCPGCSVPMRPFQAGKIELDRCSFCNGLWFDGGELEAILGKKLSAVVTPGMSTARACPACKVPMDPAELGGLRVETCSKCRGFFLDDGELVALNGGKAVRIQQQAPAPAAPKPAPRPEKQVQDDVMGWLDSLGV